MPRTLQYKLSALFVLVLVVSLPLGCLAYLRRQIDDFHRAAAPFEEFARRPVQASGDGMAVCTGRYGLTQLNLIDADLDDARLLALKADLERLPSLRLLALTRTAIGDDGLGALENLSTLRVLLLSNTNVTDAGLERLKPLRGLIQLRLERTQVTDSGVEELKRSLPNCEISR